MSQELIFELDDVRVTPYIAQFGGTSYQIGSISSVRARQTKRLSRAAVFMFLLGVGLFVAAILRSSSEEQVEANFSVAVSAVGIIFFSFLVQLVLPRRVFKLILRTHGGDVEVLASNRSKFILDVKQAVEDAFVVHARRSSRQASE
jgi:Family of unknown function (DUF6232)